jgi:predicted nucleic acid-binding protein
LSTKILVDSNVILDIFNIDNNWFEWSSSQIEKLADTATFYINPIIYSEISISFSRIEELENALPADLFTFTDLPRQALFLAGKTFLSYKRNGGKRNSTLPDFFIGAHAVVEHMTLLTRDVSRYKTYFPSLQLITP